MKINQLFFRWVKLCFDILASFILIVLLSPFFLVIALVIKCDSKGAVLFKQERLGLYGRPFHIYKFRTMVENAQNMGDGVIVKSDLDPRITKIGRFLRRSGLDELPQLFNIMCAKMSFIGPRPPLPTRPYDGIDNYPEWAKVRFLFRPGVTGLAQVTVRNSVPWDERLKYDVTYADKSSLLLELKIIGLTLKRLIKPQSLYYLSQDHTKNKSRH